MTKYFLVVLLFTEGAQVGHPPERFEVGPFATQAQCEHAQNGAMGVASIRVSRQAHGADVRGQGVVAAMKPVPLVGPPTNALRRFRLLSQCQYGRV